jgi:hypothetical protein
MAMPAAVALRCAAHQRRRRAAGELPLPLLPLPRYHSASHRGAAANDAALPPCCQAGHRHRAAVALPIALLPLMTPCCRRTAITLPIALLPLMTPCCCRAAKLAAAAALLPPPRYRPHPAAMLPATAALLPRCRCRLRFYCHRCRRRLRLRTSANAAADALPRRCRVGQSFRRLVSRLIGWLVGPNASTTSSGLTFRVHDRSPNLDPDLDRAKKTGTRSVPGKKICSRWPANANRFFARSRSSPKKRPCF